MRPFLNLSPIVFSIALATAMLSLAVLPSAAQEFSESHIAAAKRAINASDSTERFDDILPTIAQNAKAELIRTRPDQELQITTIVDEAALALAPRRADLENEIAELFARTFAEDELNMIADFYESEVGQKFLRESPILIREMNRSSQVWANGVRRDLARMVREKLTEAGFQ